ncbi:hypothetical protein IFM89_005496 [Coptis chinensis]|uniref:ARC105/Med15 mediator subunit C-terminal domain-containing protein n=1 Tax=Coptis chinensis TaxID=261450 RepID=A0A835GVJ1_9MAGN|nr:hypothetical protein IFM89_005496 [Coptis chinensis]
MSHQLVQQQQKQNTMQQQQEQKPLQRQPHPYQMNDISDMHGKQSMNVKSGMLPQHHAEGQKSFYSHQPPLTPGALLRSLSPQSLQASSPHTSQHSPQTDPQSMISPSLSKSGTPIQSANSPMISLSPSTCFTPSPIPSDHEKQNTGAPFQSNAGGKRQAVTSGSQSHSPVIDTPGILSPALLAEVASPDKNQGCASTVISGKTIETESPTERLIKAVKSMSHKALRASVSEMYSTVSVVDMIAGSNPGNHSEARVGEDLAAMVKHSLLASNFLSQDGVVTAKNMNFHSSGLPMTVVTSDGSVCHSSKLSNGMETSDLDSTATSRIKRPRVEVNEAMLEEIKDINWQLINTVLDISEENSFTSALSEVGHGTIVKCSFTPFNFSPSQAFPVLPIFLLVSVNYPNTSPVLLDKLPLSLSEEHERFFVEARSQFHRSMRCLPQPMSLREMAKSWDTCARAVLTEYALQNGGGSFSSKYGTWKNVASTS